jgi:hypothetical protein
VVGGGGVGEAEEAENQRVLIAFKAKRSDIIQENHETLNQTRILKTFTQFDKK